MSNQQSAINNPQLMELTVDDLKELRGLVSERALAGETVLLNMGPQHPSTHGVLRLLLEIDGEIVITCIPDVGFLHTGIEKTAENKTYLKVIPLTDRMDYLSPMSNNLGYVMAVEKLMDVDVPLRAQYVRVILCELQRLSSHLVWLGTHALDLAAMSVFLYCFREREKILDIFELVSGQRMMASYFRPGGLWRDLPAGFEEAVRAFLDHFPDEIREYEGLLTKNPLWIDRTRGIGVISAQDAVAWGVTGPSLRGSGVNWDIRKAIPYSAYDHFDFDVPLADEGDVYARFWVRVQEMWQSVRIIEQAMKKLPRPAHHRQSQGRAAAEGRIGVLDGIVDPSFQVVDGRLRAAAGRSVRAGRVAAWRVCLLPQQRRHAQAAPGTLPRAVVCQPVGHAQDDPGRVHRRSGRHHRLD